MKKIMILFFLPMLCLCQNSDCGQKPIKPVLLENQTKKDYKKSEKYIEYKAQLRIWKSCMSPLGMSERDEKRMEKSLSVKAKSKIISEKFLEKISSPCGKKPIKPERVKGQKHDNYIKTPKYIEYKKLLKEWKRCKSPQGISKRNQETMDKDFEKIHKAIAENCGEKPQKPKRKSGTNNQEYKESAEHIEYRKNLKAWKDCSNRTKKSSEAGPCGEKPKKPFREQGLDHQTYKETPEYIEYQKAVKTWRDCNGEQAQPTQ